MRHLVPTSAAAVVCVLVLAVPMLLTGGCFDPVGAHGIHQASTRDPAVDGAPKRPVLEQRFQVWRGGAADLPQHTILRPALVQDVPFQMPVVVWGNGGCRNSSMEADYFLRELASTGVLVIAIGPPRNPFDAADLSNVARPRPELLIDAIDWALAQNRRATSLLKGRVDTRRVLVMGQSCGGWEATDASSDPRVDATVVWNSGANPQHLEGLTELHAPILFAHGGPTDHVAWDAEVSYAAVGVPAVKIWHPDGGHTNWFSDPADGDRPTLEQTVPLPITLRWMAATLYDRPSAVGYFVGETCGLCAEEGWNVASKNWP